MSTSNYQFIQTRNMFRDYLSGYPKSPTYDEWVKADTDDKAALLYVTFFQEITLAWYKAITSRKIVYVSQEDGVSTVLQYLVKIVPIINSDPKKYSSSYIYRVAYNCIGCLPRYVRDKTRAEIEISNEYIDDDIEVNLWDLVPSEDDDLETMQTKEIIWNIIHHMGPKAEKVVNHLINPSDTLNRVTNNPSDRLAGISVDETEYAAIVKDLKVKLLPYKDIFVIF